jgi:hypothetical protein
MESQRWFDRYLALHGIRVNDHRTYKDRTLTHQEKRAIDAVAGGRDDSRRAPSRSRQLP